MTVDYKEIPDYPRLLLSSGFLILNFVFFSDLMRLSTIHISRTIPKPVLV